LGCTERPKKTAYVFEGFWDFLTWFEISKEEHLEERVFALNSLSFTKEVGEKIISDKSKIDTVLLFLDNDEAGQKATTNLVEMLEEQGFIVGTMNHHYEGFNDLNDFWRQKKNNKIHVYDHT
jgi:5S rRNA maturation endonuclease (ribonuclease M5)